MALDDDIRILGKVNLFEPLTAEQLRLLAFGAERLTLRAGRELFREDQIADCAYVVVSGEISLFQQSATGSHHLYTAKAGSIIGELALIAETQRLNRARAETETEVLRLNRSVFRRILEEYPEVAIALHKYVSEGLIKLVSQIEKIAPQLDGKD